MAGIATSSRASCAGIFARLHKYEVDVYDESRSPNPLEGYV